MGEHAYVSTACQHQLHQQCRRTCKFCPAGCYCVCHGTGERSRGPLDASRVDPYDSTKGLTAPCGCHLCQSMEGHYESRCGACDELVVVVRGRVEEHGSEGARCPASGEDAS